MIDLKGKTLIFTDIHFGLRNDSVSRLEICAKVVDDMLERMREEDAKNIIFCGDWFHVRNAVNVNTMNVALDCLRKLMDFVQKKGGDCVFVIGNHDIFNKNSTDVNSIKSYGSIPNFHLVETIEEGFVNGKKALFCPWLSDFSDFEKESFDLLFGHYDVPDNYIAKTYIDENTANEKVSNEVSMEIDGDVAFSKVQQKNDTLGDYVELAKKTGTVFSGHIHQHREFKSKGRRFIFIGSPYQQNTGEAGFESGFYILDDTGKYRFYETRGVPKHVKLRMSDILLHGVDKFDFSVVKGNIVKKIYDCEVDRVVDGEIVRKIVDNGPYEELTPEYEVMAKYENDPDKNTIELIKKDQIQYIRNYVDTMDRDALEKESIDPDELFNVLEKYYRQALEK